MTLLILSLTAAYLLFMLWAWHDMKKPPIMDDEDTGLLGNHEKEIW